MTAGRQRGDGLTLSLSKAPVCRHHPFNIGGLRHYCQDPNAVAFSGRWLCHCPGAPYFTSEAMRAAYAAQRQIDAGR